MISAASLLVFNYLIPNPFCVPQEQVFGINTYDGLVGEKCCEIKGGGQEMAA